jgi:hypothetical protein
MNKREMVEIRLGRKSDGSTARDAAFVVLADDPDRCGMYSKKPDVIAQLAPGEDIARFEATWDGKEWKFGRRVQDAKHPL